MLRAFIACDKFLAMACFAASFLSFFINVSV
jgi:hypothetical protein